MQQHRQVKPEIVYGAAIAVSVILGYLIGGYIADVARLSFLFFGVIGFVAESITADNKTYRNRALLLILLALTYTAIARRDGLIFWLSLGLLGAASALWFSVVRLASDWR